MLRGYRMKKRSMPAYDKIIVPELRGLGPIPEEKSPPAPTAKHHIRNALRAAACVVLAFVLISVIVSNDLKGAKNSFTLVAYAASASENPSEENGYTLGLKSFDMSTGVTMQKNTNITLPVIKHYIAKDADGNNYGSNIDDFSIFEGANIIESSKYVEYSSGFQFSGDNIDLITITSLKGSFLAYDYSVVLPINQKYAKIVDKGNGVSVCTIDDKDFSDSDKEFLDSHYKRGQTVTFPPAGYTAYWRYMIDNNEKTSDTITITIKYSNGSTQESVVSISEDDHGNVIAELN